ncbi:MAG: hypothetical protein DI535_10890 [Citrobacter freundii]|nr:MAG: hypothetical protein DI535_10890 [Citrobacter freundii]
MHPFFFIVTNDKFFRIDLNEITKVTVIKDQAEFHTSPRTYYASVSIDEIKQLLPSNQFIWISEDTAVPLALSARSC